MLRKASNALKTCPRPRWFGEAGTTGTAPVPNAAGGPIGFARRVGSCMTWAIPVPAVPATSTWSIRNIAAPAATPTLTPAWTTWPCRRAITPIGWWRRRYDWWWRTACRIASPLGTCGGIIGCSSRGPRSRTGWRPGGKKSETYVHTEYLDETLASFSGYIAADELYDGPFCVLSIVDNHRFCRLTYEVLDHNPTQEDMDQFFRRFRTELDRRGLRLSGVTTDGSPLYPAVLADLFPGVPHQICEFHILKELLREILKAVASVRRELKALQPRRPRGRPSGRAAVQAVRRRKRLQARITDLFDHRHLFVQRILTPAERQTLRRITRGFPRLRALRSILEEVYRLFDRRCRTDTALAKLARLRRRVRRFKGLGKTLKKLFTPNLEKALTFLDDALLPSTSNAVERANRRHRKMQKSIYQVRTREHIAHRIAVDMQRDAQAEGRKQTTLVLHWQRTKRKVG